jgi:hypothetical protein
MIPRPREPGIRDVRRKTALCGWKAVAAVSEKPPYLPGARLSEQIFDLIFDGDITPNF